VGIGHRSDVMKPIAESPQDNEEQAFEELMNQLAACTRAAGELQSASMIAITEAEKRYKEGERTLMERTHNSILSSLHFRH